VGHYDSTTMVSKPTVIVMGGGVAGIATAIFLRELGYQVTLVEGRKFLGGRAFSYVRKDSSVPIDNGQHIILGCCEYFLNFIEKIDSLCHWNFQSRLNIPIRNKNGKRWYLKTSFLPYPLHFLSSLITYRMISFWDKINIARAILISKLTDVSNMNISDMSFYDWLKSHHQSERAIKNFWEFLIKPVVNDSLQNVDASVGLMFVNVGLLGSKDSAKIACSTKGLTETIGKPSEDYLKRLGCNIYFGSFVKYLEVSDGRISAVHLNSGKILRSSLIVSALPFDSLAQVLNLSNIPSKTFLHSIQKLTYSPIMNVYLWYDKPIMKEQFCMVLDSPLEWVFNRTSILSINPGCGNYDNDSDIGYCVCISVSAAREYMDWTKQDIIRFFSDEIDSVFHGAKEAKILDAVVVKQPNATICCQPGINTKRPSSGTPIKNFFIAGDWCDTGWPSTMEGAVRSGYKVTQHIQALSREE